MNPTPLTTLLATDPTQLETQWLIPNLLPLGLSLLLGQPRIGKSWLALHLALSISLGELALDQFPTNQTDVLYIGLQDNPHRMCARTRKLLANRPAPSNFTWTNQVTPSASSTPTDTITDLDHWLTTHPQTRLLVIDSLDQLLTPPSSSRPRNHTRITPQQEIALMHQLKILADKHRIAILLLNQLPTKASRHPLHELMYTPTCAIADTLLILTRNRGQADATLLLTGTDLPDQELALRLPTDTLRWTLLGPAADYQLSQQRQDILNLLEEHGGGPLSPKDIATLLHKDRRTITKLLFDMSHASQLRLTGRGLYMSIQDNTTHEPEIPTLDALDAAIMSNVSNESNENFPPNYIVRNPILNTSNNSNVSNHSNHSNHSNQTPTNTPSTPPSPYANISNHSNQSFIPINEQHFLGLHPSGETDRNAGRPQGSPLHITRPDI